MRALLFVLAFTPAARAGDSPPGKVHVGLHAGVVLPQVATHFSTAAGLELEGGVRVWRNLSPTLAVGYSQPSVSGDRADPRLAGTRYTTDTTQRELTLTLGALWRFLPASSVWNVFAGAGARAYFLQTITNGASGGASFEENRETSTRVGGVISGGAELSLGPGAAVLRVEGGGSRLPHLITGDVSTAAVATTIGYRLFF